METRSRVVELYHYLQDPHLVARFQRFCGVHGSFTASTDISGSSKESDRAHTLQNGACVRHHPAAEHTENTDVLGAGEGEKKPQPTDGGVRRRNIVENHLQNGSVLPLEEAEEEAATAGGETVGAAGKNRNGRSAAEFQDSDPGKVIESSGTTTTRDYPTSNPTPTTTPTRVKPLRRNSLTGDAGQAFMVSSPFLYWMFTLGTELGNEPFYISFFPFVMWNVDVWVSRRLVVVWVWVMYLGQCTKDVLGWSRPSSPPVVKVEMFYNSEYSMPSTHAMSGTAIPFALFAMTYGRWEYPWALGFSLALCWCLLVCVSRIYMGMHSVLDVIAGFLYSVLILLFFLPSLDLIDTFNQSYRYAPLLIVSLHLGLGLFSFTLDTWSTSRGDTAQILGSGAGVALASHVNYIYELFPDPEFSILPLKLPEITLGLIGASLARFAIGVVVLLATRAVMKAVCIPCVCVLTGVARGDVRKARQHMQVELPYRYIVYGTVGFNTLFLVPQIFTYFGL